MPENGFETAKMQSVSLLPGKLFLNMIIRKKQSHMDKKEGKRRPAAGCKMPG
jgi:hypothetical protein